MNDRAAAFSAHAQRYSELGWALIRAEGKKPPDARWQTATPAEPRFAAGQWARWGERFNLGVVLGQSLPPLAVFEYDAPEAREQFLELLGGRLPQTPSCKTGSGRGHVYFENPDRVPPGSRDGLELRAGGQQCLLPPSIHPSTQRPYEWVAGHAPWEIALAPLPANVVEYFHQSQNGAGPAAPIGDVIPEGERNRTLASLAGSMRRRGSSETAILAALRVENERCRPALSDDELVAIARSIARYAPAAATPTGDAVLRDPEEGTTTRRWQLRPLARATPRQTRWLVRGLIPLRFLTLVAGIGGLGKSTWLLRIAADGSIADEPWDTIYVSFEDTADEVLRPRVEAASGNPERVHELVLTDADSLDAFSLPRDVEELHDLVRQCSARLVVIDPVVAAVDTKLDAYKDQHVRQVLAQLWRVAREEDCAIALVGHLNRVPSTDAFLRIANSMAFWNASRSVVLVTEDGDEQSGLRLIAQRKANLARLAPVERHRLEEIVLPGTVDQETGKPIVTSRMTFVEIADDVNASEILGPQRTTKTESAEMLLDALLADGDWHERDGVVQLMAAAGFPERTTQRAEKDLGVEIERRGFPSTTWWRLPVAPSSGAQVGATVDSAQPRGFCDTGAPVAPTRVELGAGATGGVLECLVCGEEYAYDEDRPELLRCSGCIARAAA